MFNFLKYFRQRKIINNTQGGEMKKTKKQIIARMNEIGVSKRVCLGSCNTQRAVDTALIDEEKKIIPFILVSNDNAGERYDWWEDEVFIEELDVTGAKFERLNTFFTDHNKRVDNAIGRVEDTIVEDGQIKATVHFGSDVRSLEIFQKFADGILTDVSIGYRVNDVVVTTKKDEPDHVLITDFDIMELSAVWRGFDAGASVGRSQEDVLAPKAKTMDTRSIDVLRKKLNLEEN